MQHIGRPRSSYGNLRHDFEQTCHDVDRSFHDTRLGVISVAVGRFAQRVAVLQRHHL